MPTAGMSSRSPEQTESRPNRQLVELECAARRGLHQSGLRLERHITGCRHGRLDQASIARDGQAGDLDVGPGWHGDVGDERVLRADVAGLGLPEELLVELLVLAQAGVVDASGAPDCSISWRATSAILIGWPITRSRASPGRPIAPAWTTSWQASSIVMK